LQRGFREIHQEEGEHHYKNLKRKKKEKGKIKPQSRQLEASDPNQVGSGRTDRGTPEKFGVHRRTVGTVR